jgi:CheY-like chemotaxis protein
MEHVRKVLVVEDEATLRLSMVRGLAKLEGVQVAAASCTREAKEELTRGAPDLLISDLDLPDGSGLEVVAEAERLGLRVPVVFISAFLGRFRSRIPQRADVQVYEKPVSLERLRALVEERLGPRVEGMPTSPFGVPDYVQLASLGRYSVVIEVHSAGAAGQILVHRGELWHARDAAGEGIAAFRRLAFQQPARVTCRTLGKHELPARTMDGSAESVLLDAARAFDEGPQDAPAQEAPPAKPTPPPVATVAASAPPPRPRGLPPPPAVVAGGSPRGASIPPVLRRAPSTPPKAPPGVWQDAQADAPSVPPAARVAPVPASEPETLCPNPVVRGDALVSELLQQRFDAAFERGVDALLTKDFSAAYAAFAEAEMLRPDDRRVAANLTRLRALGVLS